MGDVIGVGCSIDEDIVPELAGDRTISRVWLSSFDDTSDAVTLYRKGWVDLWWSLVMVIGVSSGIVRSEENMIGLRVLDVNVCGIEGVR